jgi:hemerythrin superfamily protein
MQKTKAEKKQPLALEALSADHRKVEALFKDYDKAKQADDDSRRDIAETICVELTMHATIEEEIFYPWLRETLDDDDMDLSKRRRSSMTAPRTSSPRSRVPPRSTTSTTPR